MIAPTVVCLALSLLLQVQCEDLCETYTSCKTCVQDPSCHWCSANNFKHHSRCMTVKNNMTECPQSEIQDPKGSVVPERDTDFTQSTQIKPQSLRIKLRPSKPLTFDFSFKAAKNYPADLYFLLDCSNTMRTILNTTFSASEKIYKKMLNKTDNVSIGMGTFIDKNTAPYLEDKGDEIYSFRHHLNMTQNIMEFKLAVNETVYNTKKNMDALEGGFDALAQAITCKEQIGWRNESTKIIFFFTDQLSHIAGDGKPAGIFYPYDGQCYTVNGSYTNELEMDYPSISMISELAANNGVTIVFIVKSSRNDSYAKLTQYIQGSKWLTYEIHDKTVTFDESDLENVISKIYEEITQNVQLAVSMSSEDNDNIRIDFKPNCVESKNAACKMQQNEEKKINGSITLLRYYEKDNDITLNISVVGNTKDRLALHIEVADCECGEAQENSPDCSDLGTKKCGTCECNKNRYGKRCECKVGTDSAEDDTSCKSTESPLPCFGNGVCECGICKCNKDREGKFCQCIKDTCEKKCNGHGECYCDECRCFPDWTGRTCNCHQVPCKKDCNGRLRGDCKCGKCKCKEPAIWDARDEQDYETCEIKPCTNCHEDQCLKLEKCAICRQINDESHCSSLCGDIIVEVIESLGNTSTNPVCEHVKAEIGCYSRFQYYYDDVNYKIHLLVGKNDKNCNENYYIWGGGVLVVLLVIGVLTLVAWKLLTDMRDRREYHRFLKMHGNSQFACVNPIYEPATTTIRNPAFRKPSVDYNLR